MQDYRLMARMSAVITMAASVAGCPPAGVSPFDTLGSAFGSETQAAGGYYPEAYQCQRIAVAAFQGEDGEWIAGQMEGRLHRVGHYKLVDRRELDRALEELKRQQDGRDREFDPNAAARVGRIVGADCFLSGSVNLAKIEREDYEERLCEVMGAKFPVPSEDLCPGTMEHATCQGAKADAILVPRMVDVETATVIFAQTASGQAFDRSCKGNRLESPASEAELRQEAIDQAIAVIVADLTPKPPGAPAY